MGTQQQNPDGTWGPAELIPWFDGIDWEVYGKGRERRAVAYRKAEKLTEVGPGRFFDLRLRLADRRLRKAAS